VVKVILQKIENPLVNELEKE